MIIEARQMFRPNGLIDDLVVYATPKEYLSFAELVGQAVRSKQTISVSSESAISIEIVPNKAEEELFTSLQNQADEYLSMDEWNHRNTLRVFGNELILSDLQRFLIDLAGRGEGYSYISEYSERNAYSSRSPEWRLQVEAN